MGGKSLFAQVNLRVKSAPSQVFSVVGGDISWYVSTEISHNNDITVCMVG